MANPAGSFIWYELMTPDPDAVRAFYQAVVGWTISPADPQNPSGQDYRMLGRADGTHAGGVLRLSGHRGSVEARCVRVDFGWLCLLGRCGFRRVGNGGGPALFALVDARGIVAFHFGIRL